MAKQIHNTRELEHAATRAGCRIECDGRHKKLVTPTGRRVPYTSHTGDMARGTLRSILKALAAAGVVLGTIAVVVAQVAQIAGG